MRIAMISTPFVSVPPRDYGGTELVVAELVDGLIEHGHDVTLFATGDSSTAARLRYLFPKPHWPPSPLRELNHASWALAEALAGDFDIVHAHSAAALACARWPGSPPLVYTMHHARDEELSAFYADFPDVETVAISADQAAREIPLRRLSVIHHGLDPNRYEWRPEARSYVAFLGRMAPVKGAHHAIDAAVAAGVDIRVAGEVHETDREFGEREMAHRLLLPTVTPLGNIGSAMKVPLLRDARALLAPIEWNEPFGLAMIEAMLSGCPVVAFPRGSVRELVEPGVTGFIVHDVEEMAEFIRPGGAVDYFDRQRCRARAVQRFSRQRMVRDYEWVYDRARRPQRDASTLRTA